jgi:hypothetical protein
VDVPAPDPDANGDVIELLTVFKYHEYPVGAIPLAGAVQLNDQLLSPEIVRVTPVAGLGIPTAADVNCALFVPVVVFDVIAVR